MLKGAPVGSIGKTNPSGWSNSSIFLEYLHHITIHTRSNRKKKILLIIDNYESRISVERLDFAKDNSIVMLTMPSHTSHKLQLFGPLKKYYNTACSEWLLMNSGKPTTIYDVAECVGEVYPKAFSAENIQSGFRVLGISPLNRHRFADHEFLSTCVTDRLLLSEPPVFSASSPSQNPSPALSASLNEPLTLLEFPQKSIMSLLQKPGRCRLLTDTPKKHEIKELAAHKDGKDDHDDQIELNQSSQSEEEAPEAEILDDLKGSYGHLENTDEAKFVHDDETVYEVDKMAEIAFKLPALHVTGRTERRNREMTFYIDFSLYNKGYLLVIIMSQGTL
ncbi:hypothetical protein ILUMI_02864 [Ignelater luminosus]|uniref:DDE-1 domain-containing protein n=1 Tax=Ignelater luminosus TaxID=2038154 RepID=A0A8K0DFQ0_IGNLU|nr:hypothetical protein ILUMI_02864 [Ignelater luminosus]